MTIETGVSTWRQYTMPMKFNTESYGNAEAQRFGLSVVVWLRLFDSER